jgi:hypothetical protein
VNHLQGLIEKKATETPPPKAAARERGAAR